ncbi:MAG: 8-oxo-dGTP diphosphatase [Candidatus Andersenbacteria bacterium]|nr:8-oxo-dGTP diphosphatase [Candidatus Andersenbacteria bacterium]MBI3250935.1 8-oxo-dGTP diphosphatase [Candidatus Andersenbacteria bacterium]
MRKVFTLAIVVKDGKILLGKKQKKHGAGFWNGFGGGVEAGETIKEAAIRECQEEAEITPTDMEKSGEITFIYPDAPLNAREHEVHIFTVRTFTGTPASTSEMQEPTWFAPEEIPYNSMWPDDKQWLPLLLQGKQFSGYFRFNEAKEIVDWQLQ